MCPWPLNRTVIDLSMDPPSQDEPIDLTREDTDSTHEDMDSDDSQLSCPYEAGCNGADCEHVRMIHWKPEYEGIQSHYGADHDDEDSAPAPLCPKCQRESYWACECIPEPVLRRSQRILERTLNK